MILTNRSLRKHASDRADGVHVHPVTLPGGALGTASHSYYLPSALARKPKRERTKRREATRAAISLSRERERLYALERGGSSDRPLDVEAASVIEVRAASVRCPRCDGTHLLEEHAAVVVNGTRLREARLVCRSCGTRRSLWFRLPVLN